MEKCPYHEALESKVDTLLERGNDFTVKVINGKTTERLASELIGEMYVAMKELQEKTFVHSFFKVSRWATALIPILFLVAVILMFLGYHELASQISTLRIK